MVTLKLFESSCRFYNDPILSQGCSAKLKEFVDSHCDNDGFNIVEDFERHSSMSLSDMLNTDTIGHVSIRIDIKVGENFVISKFGKIFRK